MPEDWFIPKWLQNAPYAPTYRVRDTLHKYGRYAPEVKTISVVDLIKFHGHLCGGLMEAAVALRAGFNRLFGGKQLTAPIWRSLATTRLAAAIIQIGFMAIFLRISGRLTKWFAPAPHHHEVPSKAAVQ